MKKSFNILCWLIFDVFFLYNLYKDIMDGSTGMNIVAFITSICIMVTFTVIRAKKSIDSTDFKKEREELNSHSHVHSEFLKILRHKNLEDLRLIEDIVYTIVLICVFVSGAPSWFKFLLSAVPILFVQILMILNSINQSWLRKTDSQIEPSLHRS